MAEAPTYPCCGVWGSGGQFRVQEGGWQDRAAGGRIGQGGSWQDRTARLGFRVQGVGCRVWG